MDSNKIRTDSSCKIGPTGQINIAFEVRPYKTDSEGGVVLPIVEFRKPLMICPISVKLNLLWLEKLLFAIAII